MVERLPLPLDEDGLLDGRFRPGELVALSGLVRDYEAYDLVREQPVVIRLLGEPCTPEFIERLRGLLERLQPLQHPSIERIYQMGATAGRHYVVVQGADGAAIKPGRDSAHPVPVDQLAGVALELASALEAIHANQLLHCAVCPQNLLLDTGGKPMLLNRGMAWREAGIELVAEGGVVGRVSAMAPEQLRGQTPDERSELFSLSLLLYQLTTGQAAFSGRSLREHVLATMDAPPRNPRELRPDLPQPLAGCVLRCLEKRPEDRYRSASELRMALEALADPEG